MIRRPQISIPLYSSAASDVYKRQEDMHVTIDEIKGIYMNLDALDEPVGVHRAQAMCYAYIYALQHDLAEISVQLTYCNLDTIELTKTAFLGNLKYFRETFSFAELAEWFTRLTDEYKTVSYTHLRAHETGRNLVCRLLLEKKKTIISDQTQ